MASSIEWINSMNQISKELIRWIKLFLKVSRGWLLRAPVELINRMKMSEQRWFYVSFMSPVRSTVDASKKRKRNRRDRNWNAGGIFELFCGGMMMVFLYCNLIFHRVAGSGDEGRERMGREWGGVEGSAGRRTPPLSAASWWKITALFPRRFPMLLFFPMDSTDVFWLCGARSHFSAVVYFSCVIRWLRRHVWRQSPTLHL